MRRTKGLRYAAMRKAQLAKQERDAKRLRRERQVEAVLAEYFEHVAVVEAVEAATAAKVAAVTAAGAAEVERVRDSAALAVRAMLELGETRTAVAELTGLTLSGVRELASASISLHTDAVVIAVDVAPVRTEAPVAESEPGWGDATAGDVDDAAVYPEAAVFPAAQLPASADPPAWSDLPDWARPTGDPYAA